MSGLAFDSSTHVLRGFCFWGTPLVVLILSSLCRHYISPFSPGRSGLRIDWTEGGALGELTPSSPPSLLILACFTTSLRTSLWLSRTCLPSQIRAGQPSLNANLRQREHLAGVHGGKLVIMLNALMPANCIGRSQAVDDRGFVASRRRYLFESRSAMRTCSSHDGSRSTAERSGVASSNVFWRA